MIDFRLFRTKNNLSQKEVATLLNVSTPFISQVENGKVSLPPEKLSILLNNDKGWDITPLISAPTTHTTPTTSVITVKSEQTMPELPIIPKALTEQSDFDIWPVIQEEKSNFEKFNLLQALRDIDFVYKVEEDVLSPHINIGDYLFLKRVTGQMKVINGTCYLLDTAYYNVILRYVYDDGECYKLKTPNRPYSEVSIPKDKVYGTYIIKGKYTSHIATPDNTVKQLKQQSQQIASLVNSVGSLIDITTSSSKRTDKLIDMLQTEIDKHHNQ